MTALSLRMNRSPVHALRWAFALNALMFFIEAGVGYWIGSTALLADSLDMLADASVYALSLYAAHRGAQHKALAAGWHAVSHLLLALLLIAEVIRCTLSNAVPAAAPMSVLAVLAMLVNFSCVLLLSAHRQGDINLRASWLCSRNDLIGNVSVLLAALLVGYSGSAWPDRLVGLTMALLMLYTAIPILREAWPQWREPLVKATSTV